MSISVVSFTEQGRLLAEKIKNSLSEKQVEIYHKPKEGVVLWAGEQFALKKEIVFIGACGIAVRAIAPFVKDKLSDSPVLAADETGRYVIPLLSGHVGGANELAELIAERIGAAAVITTATDIHGKFAVDVFAKKNALTIINKEGIAAISAKVLEGKKIKISVEDYENRIKNKNDNLPQETELLSYPPQEQTDIVISTEADRYFAQAVLRLKPKEYVLGIGCKKGKTKEEISEFILETLKRTNVRIEDVAAIASIDRKKKEEGICQWAEAERIPFLTFSKDELQAVKGSFCSSSFVEQTVGVDNVCERAALAACGTDGKLVLKKQSKNGITLAAAKRKWQIEWKKR